MTSRCIPNICAHVKYIFFPGFEVYTGKDQSAVIKKSRPVDPTCTKTTKLVIGLLDHLQLLDRGHHVYLDNYYMSPELCSELVCRDTFCAGTVRKNRKGVSHAVKDAKLRKGECVFRRNDEILCLKYCDKRPVMFLSTIHAAVDTFSSCRSHADNVVRPQIVNDYVKYMRGCDVSDQLLTSYSLHRKSVRWSRKLFFHFFALAMNNAYVLFRTYGQTRISHFSFLEQIAISLITESLPTANCRPPQKGSRNVDTSGRFLGHHYPEQLPPDASVKRSNPVKLCQACNFSKTELAKEPGAPKFLKRKNTSFFCRECSKSLCVTPCFKAYHTMTNYRQYLLKHRAENK